MPNYECVYLARQDVTASQVEALSDGFAEIVANGGGEVKKREYWGLRNLAYRVKKNRKAHYTLMNIEAPAAAVHEMQRIMHLNADVLRELILRVDELNEGPSIMMQRREERRDRGDRRSRRDDERRSERAAPAERAAPEKAAPEEAAPENDTANKEAADRAPADREAPAEAPTEAAAETPVEAAAEAPVETAADEADESAAEKTADNSGGDS